jgi:L-glutamine:2-deoxy-scyllo-inosose/3-amino-2,3-dideoxy-scyllo-inosose aminotransferase
MTGQLAIAGGEPVWRGGWPAWPEITEETQERIRAVLHSGRWAVSGAYVGSQPVDVLLSQRFADFCGARWCVPVDHGSSALVAALVALGVRPGDEVVVPGLTWVACASAVARIGAVPVLADVDENTLCVHPGAVAAAITARTAAIMVVHLYSAMADMDAIGALAERHHLPVIEDSAQAYGATWRGRGAGSLGTVGTFSAQQGKTLTSGEGGLLVTSDPSVRAIAEMVRGDGRRYRADPPPYGQPDLEEVAAVQGWNMHMTELQAALLLDGLDRLPEQNRRRAHAAAVLDKHLTEHGDLVAIEPHPGNDLRAYYHYAIRLREGAFHGQRAETVCRALSAELGYWIHPPYRPLNGHPLFDPRRLGSIRAGTDLSRWDPARFPLPVAERQARQTVLLHHPMLLGTEDQLQAIVEAVDKVRRHAHELSDAAA